MNSLIKKRIFENIKVREELPRYSNLIDLYLCIPSDDTARTQEAHTMAGHICEIVESELLSNNYNREEQSGLPRSKRGTTNKDICMR